MRIEELLKFSDFCDARGEHEAANAIDALIKGAGDEGYGQVEQGQEHYEDKGADTTDANKVHRVQEEHDIQDSLHTYKKIAWSASLDLFYAIEELQKLMSDEELIPYIEKIKNKLDVVAGFKNPNDNAADDNKVHICRTDSLAGVFSKLTKISDSLDESGIPKAADMVDNFIQKYSSDEPIPMYIDKDRLDTEPLIESDRKIHDSGEKERKHHLTEQRVEDGDDCPSCKGHKYVGVHGTPCPRCDGSGVYNDDRTDEERYKEQEEYDQEGLGDTDDEMEDLSKEWMLSQSKTRAPLLLSKRAEGNSVRDTKEEDDTEQSKRYDSDHHHNLLIREPKRDQEKVDREGRGKHHINTFQNQEEFKQKKEAHNLSTRYCPNHIGDQMGRIGEGIYQCPRDGEVFSWANGWTDFEGVYHPGGSVAQQTPDSTGYEIPNRVFDSRSKVLNVVN